MPADDREHRSAQLLGEREDVERRPVVVVVRVLEPLAVLRLADAVEERVVGDRQPRRDGRRVDDRPRVLAPQLVARVLVDVEALIVSAAVMYAQ